MKNRLFLLFGAALLLAGCAQWGLTRYVDPMIGAATVGHCSPCATFPLGMVNVGPQSGNFSWEYTSGYQYADSLLQGFSHNRLNGTGCPDLGDLLMFPFSGTWEGEAWRSRYDKASEKAEPGYYCVRLTDAGVFAEMAASEHCSIMNLVFDEPSSAHLLIDFQSNMCWSEDAFFTHVIESGQDFSDPMEITGKTRSRIWVDRYYYYDIQFSEPYTLETALPKRDDREVAQRQILSFDIPNGKPLTVKVSISRSSVGGARGNLAAEIPGWDLSKVRSAASREWERILDLVEVEGTDEQKVLFYSAMYRAFVHPDNVADAGETPFFSTLSLWDTFRAEHPLLTILTPEKAGEMVHSMLVQHSEQGFLPIWALWGIENYCMIGNHAVPVVADAILKGIGGFDYEEAWRAVKSSLTEPHRNSDWESYDACGYFPFDITGNESASRTLECAYDDWCAAQIARKLGYEEDYDFFYKRSQYYRNIIDPEALLARGRDSKGNWREPFNPYLIPGGEPFHDFTEGNSWQYTWHVMQDIPGLIELFGGPEVFCDRLDQFFSDNSPMTASGQGVPDVSGLVGQYAHGNEPSHHVAYLYELAGQPHKTEELVHRICTELYTTGADGLCGNDDCGQMSAWYIFSVLGFYPVNPCGGEYVVGAPQLPKAVINLPGGKKFAVVAENYAPENIHVEGITINGKPLEGRVLLYEDILAGGELRFIMTK